MASSDLIDVTVMKIHETEKAILIKQSEDECGIWLPHSQIEVDEMDGEFVTVTLSMAAVAVNGCVPSSTAAPPLHRHSLPAARQA